MCKKVIAFLLTVALCFAAVPVMASGVEQPVAMEESLAVSGDTSFGSMVAAAIEDELADNQENNGYRVFSLEVAGTTAAVELEAVDDCTLVVGIYTEDGTELLASGWLGIAAGDSEVLVTIETEEMPAYFLAKAFLVNEETEPLCPAYSTPNYTQEMQEFFAKTVEDFDADRVLNLDDDPQNNFAVFKDEVKRIDTEGKNILSVDGGTYIFQNADDTVKSLAVGDTFTCDYNGDTLLVVIATVQVAGDTVTVTEADAELEDVFDYVKLEGKAGLTETSVGEANCPEGVTFDGLEYPATQMRAVDMGGQLGDSVKYTLTEAKVGDDKASAKVSGSLNFAVEASINLYVTTSYSSMEVKLDYSVKLALAFSGEADLFELPLGVPITIAPVPGLRIEITPSFVGKVSGKVEVSGTLKGTLGFEVDTDEGMENLSSTPTFEAELKGEFTVFVGFSLEPKVVLVSQKLAEADIEATFGAEVKGEMSTKTLTDEHHECNACLDGDVSGKLALEFSAKFLNNKKWSFKLVLPEVTVKIADFYWSIDRGEFGWGTCPYISYKVEATILCADGTKARGADVTFDSEGYSSQVVSEDGGVATAYLPGGIYTVKASFAGESGRLRDLQVKNKARKITVQMSERPTAELYELDIAQISMGGNHSAALTEDGELYMWGDNSYGQLGDGTTENRTMPVWIMSDVKTVCVGGSCSAAITKSGDLYVWGLNDRYQVGNGTTKNSSTPIKVMEGVKDVSLSGAHSAAVTENGDLYMWGDNSYGRLGDGTEEKSAVPIKIMDGVKAVNLGGYHSAAITESGDLYTWGCNWHGQIGDGSTTNRSTPVKVLSNVAQIALEDEHTAAITASGELYIWGFNYAGQLGLGNDANALTPVLLMDGVKAVDLGYAATAIITENGDLYTCGSGHKGQLGMGDYESYSTPQKILENVKAVSLGTGRYGAALTVSGVLYMWGDNERGQFGISSTERELTPIPVNGRTASATYMSAASRAQTAEFNGLTPGAIYNFYVMRDKEAEEPFEAENLLYIDQGVADSEGKLTFRYVAAGEVDRFVTEMPAAAPAPTPTGLLGDVDGDGSITSTDARMTLQYYAGKIGESALNTAVADVDGDGAITSTDARLILQYYAGKITAWP